MTDGAEPIRLSDGSLSEMLSRSDAGEGVRIQLLGSITAGDFEDMDGLTNIRLSTLTDEQMAFVANVIGYDEGVLRSLARDDATACQRCGFPIPDDETLCSGCGSPDHDQIQNWETQAMHSVASRWQISHESAEAFLESIGYYHDTKRAKGVHIGGYDE